MAQKTKKNDSNFALLSIILGATSFIYTIFTGIPAIILGVMAIRQKIGNQTQAKAGIAFGIIGSLLIIPLIWLAVHFGRVPFKQQFSVSQTDYKNIQLIAKKLREYKKTNGHYPKCSENDLPNNCAEWQKFLAANTDLVRYDTEFESNPNQIETRSPGILVYANNTTCFINVPTDPHLIEDNKNVKVDKFSALVYFYEQGRSCYLVEND